MNDLIKTTVDKSGNFDLRYQIWIDHFIRSSYLAGISISKNFQ